MWQYTPYTLPLALATLVGVLSTASVWRQRERPADTWAIATQLSLTAWAATHLLTLSSETLDVKLLGFALILTAMAATVATVLGFSLHYTGRSAWLTRPRIAVLVAFPIVVSLFGTTNWLHGLILVDPTLDATGSFTVLTYERGPGFGALLAAFWGTAAVYSGLLFVKARRSRNVYRKQSLVLFVSVVVLTGLTVPSGLGLSPHPHFVLLPMAYLFVGLVLIAVTVSVRFVQLLPIDRVTARWRSPFGDIVPLARDFVMERIDDGIVIMDADGRIVDVNRTAKRMIGTDRAVGRDLREVSHLDRIIEGGPVQAMLAGEKDLAEMSDELWVDSDRGERCYDVDITALERSGGQTVGYVAVLHDVTARKRREETLEEREAELERQKASLEAQTTKLELQNERLDEFASIVSHDLRNPLNVANAYAQLAAERADEGEPADPEQVRKILKSHDRMVSIIDDALELARQGMAITDAETVDLGDAAREAWENVETAEAQLDVVADGESIRADRDRLLTVFENLFRNAVEHGEPTVTVRVGWLDEPSGFFVEDDGPGIPEGIRTDVFKRGYTTMEDGTGLGLAIVDDVARAHGWAVHVTDGTEGGARVEFHDVSRPNPQ